MSLVFEGTWEEVAKQADQLAGKRVRVTVLPVESDHTGGGAGAERARAFREWASSHPRRRDTPLPDEALSRGSIYGE